MNNYYRPCAVLLLLALALLVTCLRVHAQPSRAIQARTGAAIVAWHTAHLNVRELTGNNDGPPIDQWLDLVGSPRRSPWCGATQGACQFALGLPRPAAAGAAKSWAVPARTYYVRGVRGSLDSLRAGHRVMFFYSNLGRIGHIGAFVSPLRPIRAGRPARGWVVVAGNTGTGGGRDGAGIHQNFYPAASLYAVANWSY